MPYINRDEARILSASLKEQKYDYADFFSSKEERIQIISSLEKLEKKLESKSKDRRRFGRSTQDEFGDLLRRFMNK